MKRAVLFVVILWMLAVTIKANAAVRSVEAPELEAVASQIAGQDIMVRCWTDLTDPDFDGEAWGYVWLERPVVYMDPISCAGAVALTQGAMLPLWQLALGALVLTHESYHLKFSLPLWRRGDEAQTECRAIKRVPKTLLQLGATSDLADAILPWAIAEHYKISALRAEYNYPSCAVPVFAGFWPP